MGVSEKVVAALRAGILLNERLTALVDKVNRNDAGSISVLPELSSQATSIDSLANALNGLNTYLSKTQKRAAIFKDEYRAEFLMAKMERTIKTQSHT